MSSLIGRWTWRSRDPRAPGRGPSGSPAKSSCGTAPRAPSADPRSGLVVLRHRPYRGFEKALSDSCGGHPMLVLPVPGGGLVHWSPSGLLWFVLLGLLLLLWFV